MTRSRLGDYLTYGLGGAVLGTGAGITGSSVLSREGVASPAGTLAGTSIGLGAGLLTAYLRNKDRKNIEDLKPGWYVTERPLYGVPDIGNASVRHSAHTVIIPRKEADNLLKKKKWEGTDHYNFTNNAGKEMTAFQLATNMESRGKPWKLFTFHRMKVPFKTELNPENGVPLTKTVQVPLKKNVTLTKVLDRLKDIEEKYREGKAPVYSLLPISKIKDPGKGGSGVCHDVTTSILQNTEDLHNLQEWKPGGIISSQYIRPEVKKTRLLDNAKNELSRSFLGDVIRHTLAGAVGGGIIGGGLPILYGMDEVNPRLDKKKERYRHLANAGITGAAGAGIGGILGALTGVGSATFRRINAQRKLNQLEKESAATDYIIGGLGGAGIGAGAGMIANAITGKKLLSAPFLLGGMGVGTAGGLAVGLLRAHERKNQDMRVKPDSEAVYIDKNGVKHLRPGTYVGFAPARFLKEQQKYPILDNNIGHTFIFDVYDKPFSVVDEDGSEIHAVKMDNGDYVMSHEVLKTDIKPGDKDYTGEKWKGSRYTMAINGHILQNGWKNGDLTHFGERGANEIADIYRSINEEPGEDPKETYPKTMFYAAQFHNGQTPEQYRARNQLIYNRSKRDVGKEPLYSFFLKQLTGVDKRDCQTYVAYLLHHLARLGHLDRANIVKNIPRYIGTSLGADMHHGDKYNDTLGNFD